MKTLRLLSLVVISCAISLSSTRLRAADHADGPSAVNDTTSDIADVFLFLDPNDNNLVVISMTVRGFIVPGEAVNQGIFDPNLTYQFQVEGTGDAAPDAVINVNFSPRTSNATPQTATVQMIQGANSVFNFTAPATNPSLNAAPPTPTITTHAPSGVKFFAGEVDDPFFFDIPAFSRFVASVLSGSPNPGFFSRARDTFAGYNILGISLSVPKALLPNSNNSVGLSAATFRRTTMLANLSARGDVQGGDRVLIAGSIIAGNSAKRIIVRGIGPSLAARGVSGPLLDPTLRLVDSQGQTLASNNNWQDTQGAEITASGLAPTDTRESAIIATLQPGAYTAVVDGAGGAKGVALVEVFDLVGLPQVDRMGNPAVNVALVPFARKDEYNTATPQDDAAGRFAGDIVATLMALGTNNTYIGILAGVAVTNGDILRLNLNTANSGPGGGNNSQAAYPNGRRLADDTIDILLGLIANGNPLGDNVNANDVPLQNTFPFFALSQQPRDTGVDDNTRN